MREVYLINYSVRGIKSLDQWAKLSFYNHTITKDFSIQGYNTKGIYGANGTGKSAIITSVSILKNIILDTAYLSNPLIQSKLDELISKRTGYLEFCIEFIIRGDLLSLYKYQLRIEKNSINKHCITWESLEKRVATSHSEKYKEVYKVENGDLTALRADSKLFDLIQNSTKNLLLSASLCAVMLERFFTKDEAGSLIDPILVDLLALLIFGTRLNVYLEKIDDHTDYVFLQMMRSKDNKGYLSDDDNLIAYWNEMKKQKPLTLSSDYMSIPKDEYQVFETKVKQLEAFLQIFKPDLQGILIDKKEDRDGYSCYLIMNYGDYSINAEFESTGIKKLIKLYEHIQKMVEGYIVFVDEMDSNLHDVYLCALLEYLAEYGKGQLCFTSHNIGPRDVLKHNKKSIDFLSVDHTIYSWRANGNYSPSKLYRNGMIEGSPFNIDAIDFIGIFEPDEGE